MSMKETAHCAPYKIKLSAKIFLIFMLQFSSGSIFGQADTQSFVEVTSNYSVIPNVVYQRSGGVDLFDVRR